MTVDVPNADAERLVAVAEEFLAQVEDMTPGKRLEALLNKDFSVGNKYYDEMSRLAKIGLRDGWFANKEVTGSHYRRARFSQPTEALRWFSMTGVYMDSEAEFRGEYHAHPYGEVNMVIPISGEKPELEGLDGFWQNQGWTCPGPGSHHYPVVRGGAILALFFLPAGRISYHAKPSDPQPFDPHLRAPAEVAA